MNVPQKNNNKNGKEKMANYFVYFFSDKIVLIPTFGRCQHWRTKCALEYVKY